MSENEIMEEIRSVFRQPFPVEDFFFDILQPSGGNLKSLVAYNLIFGMYFLYTWSTREWCNLFGRTPNRSESRINHMFRNTFPMRDN